MPYKVVMIAQFITHEKEKRKALEEALAAYKQTTTVVEIRPNGKVKSANANFLESFGFTRRTLFGKPISGLIEPLSETDWNDLLEE